MPNYKITTITPTFNSEYYIDGFLKRLVNQDYDKDKLEILIIDGGSKDRTREIAASYSVKILDNPKVLAEPGGDLGLKSAQGEVGVFLAVDNYLDDTDFFKKIEKVFENPEIYAAFPKQDSNEMDTIWSRYANTFTDPFNHFVYGQAANSRTFHRVYKTLEHNDLYDVYDYNSSPVLPMIALAQGFSIRIGYIRNQKDSFDDCMPVLRLIKENKKIAYLHSLSLYHHTIRNLGHFIKKQRWATRNALAKTQYGINYRLKLLFRGQRIKIKLWPFYGISIIFPFLRSLYGLIRDRDLIWLLHPVMCFLSVNISFFEAINYFLNKNKVISRQ